MARSLPRPLSYEVLELGGVRYAVVEERVLRRLCARGGVETANVCAPADIAAGEADLDGAGLARRLVERRKRVGLSQAELARRAGIRIETLNRMEKGKTDPDFSTVRKLVTAMNAAESAAADDTPKEFAHAKRDDARRCAPKTARTGGRARRRRAR